MTSPVEGQSVYAPPYVKESGHETATTTSLTSVEAAKADLANANANDEKDVAVEMDEKDATVIDADTKSEDTAVADDEEADYLPMGPKLYLIVFSLMMAVFCVALDNTVSPPPRGKSLSYLPLPY